MKPDKTLAEKHLECLDNTTHEFTFQTFDDNQDRKCRSLARIFHGTLDKYFEELCNLSARGAGVFVTVNATDLKGRSKKNINKVRAFWIEDDHGGNITLPLEPSFVVESSPNRFHKYYLVNGFELADFDLFQQRLVRDYGSDPAAADISRVLRLAGFPHRKVNKKKGLTGDQFMVRIV